MSTPMWWHATMWAAGAVVLGASFVALYRLRPLGFRRIWQRWHNTMKVRVARRIIARDRYVLAGPRLLRSIDPDRGRCRVCGEEHAVNQDGRMRKHGCLFGDRELPARLGVAS